VTIRRIAPEIESQHLDDSRAFYLDFPGLKVGMDLGWIVTFVSPVIRQLKSASCATTILQD
jgi:hypothetical protein